MRYTITKIRNGCWEYENEKGVKTHHSMQSGAEAMAMSQDKFHRNETFIERMQKEAVDYIGLLPTQLNGTYYLPDYVPLDKFKNVIEQTIHNTLAEVERVVEGERKEEATFLKEGDEMWDYTHTIVHNRTLTTILAKLKEISK